jgi:hypothetical protein
MSTGVTSAITINAGGGNVAIVSDTSLTPAAATYNATYNRIYSTGGTLTIAPFSNASTIGVGVTGRTLNITTAILNGTDSIFGNGGKFTGFVLGSAT